MDIQLLIAILTAIGVLIAGIAARKEIRKVIGPITRAIKEQANKIRKIPGKRQTRAELIDIANSIQYLAHEIEVALRGHHTLINQINNKMENPLTQEYLDKKGEAIENIRDKQDKLWAKINKIEHRNWQGIETYYSNKKPQKRI